MIALGLYKILIFADIVIIYTMCNMEYPPLPPVRKPSSVMSWLGFGISLALLCVIWIVNIVVFSHIEESDSDMFSLYMFLFLVGPFLGLLGFIFSIVGLVQASRNFTPKWMGVCGIIFCCLSVVSFFVPMITAEVIESRAIDVDIPESVLTEDGAVVKDDVILKITRYGDIKCYDNRSGKDSAPVTLSAYSGLKHELPTWMQMKGIDGATATIVIVSGPDTDYSNVVRVIDTLKEMNIKKFRTKTYSK